MAAPVPGTVQTYPLLLLRFEAFTIFSTSLYAYSRLPTNQSWYTFAGLLLVPDLGMAGYLANTRIGAIIYNSFHTETPPIVLLCAGLAQRNDRVTGLALTWLAHIGMDRMLGYGLKYGTKFTHTHLGVIGGSKG